jgi:hypothetical protein
MLEKITEMGLDRVVWINMRVEPVIYVNEVPSAFYLIPYTYTMGMACRAMVC